MSKFTIRSKSVLAAVAVFALASATPGNAAFVSNGLTGSTEYDGWVDLKASTVGLAAALTSPTGFGSNELGSDDATLKRTSGGHYPASSSLYWFMGNSTFEIADTTPVPDVKSVVFSILTWPNPDAGDARTPESALSSLPVLNFNGLGQALPADYSGTTFIAPSSGGGFNIDLYAHTFQWDLTGTGSISSFDVDWGQLIHSGVVALQLEQSDLFTVSPAAVPEPTSMALVALAGCGLLVGRLRRRFGRSAEASQA